MISSVDILPIIFFILLLLFLITEKINRSILASLFAIFFIIFEFTSFEEAIKSIDFNTIGLLVGMMIIVSVLAKTGFFQFLAVKMVKISKGRPVRLMIALSLLSAFLSAFLDNVTTILLITPITIYITKVLNITSLPIILSLIYFSNIGGTATLIGDPPNIIIGSKAGLSFNQFLIYNGPIVIINIFLILILLYFFFKNQLRSKIVDKKTLQMINEENLIRDRTFLIKSLLILLFVIIGFLTHNITHIENSIIALGGAFLLLLITTKEPDHIYKEIEWASIFFFIGLFVIIGAIEQTGILEFIAKEIIKATGGNTEIAAYTILSFVGLISGLVDNIPITAVFVKIIQDMAKFSVDVFPLWWALSLGACFGGNITLIGASANIVAADIYNKNNSNNNKDKITFFNFFKYGFFITIVSLVSSLLYLRFVFFK